MVPDFRFKIPSEHGESQVKLAELTLLSCCTIQAGTLLPWDLKSGSQKRELEVYRKSTEIMQRPLTKQYLVQTEDREAQSRGGWMNLVTSWDWGLGWGQPGCPQPCGDPGQGKAQVSSPVRRQTWWWIWPGTGHGCGSDKETPVCRSNQGPGGMPLGSATSSWPWQQTTCQKEGVGSSAGWENEKGKALSMDQENWGSEHLEKRDDKNCLND